jgi:hypothetical protein
MEGWWCLKCVDLLSTETNRAGAWHPPGHGGYLFMFVHSATPFPATPGTVAAVACKSSHGDRERKDKGHQTRSNLLHKQFSYSFVVFQDERLAAQKSAPPETERGSSLDPQNVDS